MQGFDVGVGAGEFAHEGFELGAFFLLLFVELGERVGVFLFEVFEGADEVVDDALHDALDGVGHGGDPGLFEHVVDFCVGEGLRLGFCLFLECGVGGLCLFLVGFFGVNLVQ